MPQQNGCLDCVRHENTEELLRRDLADLQEERALYQQQAQASRQQIAQAEEQARRGHHGADILDCEDCGPKVEAALQKHPD
ncbi:MAG: hypothetical protein WD848_04280 [Dehalococcoidia bacterium]